MLLNAKNCSINKDDFSVDYVCFGNGNKNLIMIPGLGDAIRTVKGLAIPYSVIYKEYAKDYKIYLISRKNNIPKDYQIHDMANDIIRVMDEANIDKADIIGVSQGGMIAQDLSINYPNRVNKLVLAVTASKPNKLLLNVVKNWIKMAKNNDFKSIVIDTAEKSYTDDNLKKYKKLYSFLYRVNKPKNYNRFIIQAESCMKHDVYNDLNKIKAKTLIIGGKLDKILGVEASYEIHDKIKNSELFIYDNFGHGVYEHAKDFNSKLFDFLNKED